MTDSLHAIPTQFRQMARRVRSQIARKGLSPLAQAVLQERLTYLSPAKLRRIEGAVRSVENIKGDFAEFGVALGGSAILIAKQMQMQVQARQFHGFDVFGMIPEPVSEKDDSKSRSRYATIKSGASRGIDGELYYGYRDDLLADVKQSFADHGLAVDHNYIWLYKGLFEETWPIAAVNGLAFAHIDCDWYDPVVFCLNAVAGHLSPGGVIVMDDYHDYGGCRIAVDEFLSENPAYGFEDGPNPILRRRM